jgi:hypothetical protein
MKHNWKVTQKENGIFPYCDMIIAVFRFVQLVKPLKLCETEKLELDAKNARIQNGWMGLTTPKKLEKL